MNIYTVLLNQTSTDDPIATVLENTIGEIVWQRVETGVFSGVLAGAFPLSKTFIPPGNGLRFGVQRITDDLIYVYSYTPFPLALADDVLNPEPAPIEIRVYNEE